MLLVRHIKYLLTLTSKLEVNDTVIALLNQIDKFTKRNSQLAEPFAKAQFANCRDGPIIVMTRYDLGGNFSRTYRSNHRK